MLIIGRDDGILLNLLSYNGCNLRSAISSVAGYKSEITSPIMKVWKIRPSLQHACTILDKVDLHNNYVNHLLSSCLAPSSAASEYSFSSIRVAFQVVPTGKFCCKK